MSVETLIDAIGTVHTPVTDPARIVSLVPSITELLFTLGLGDQVVARTHYCIHPASRVGTIPSVGGPKKIKHSLTKGLQPSHVILNIDENPKSMAVQLAHYVPQIIVTHPRIPEDNVALYRLLGGIFKRKTAAETLAQEFEQALAQIKQEVWPRRRVLYLIWRRPWMGVRPDTYISRTLALIGWETLPVDAAVPYPVLELNNDLLDAADLILFSSEPYHFQPADLAIFSREYACPLEKLRLIDGEMTSWYGNRAIAGLRYLRQLAWEISRIFG